MAKLHMLPDGKEYAAFLELHGQIEDAHYEEKSRPMELNSRMKTMLSTHMKNIIDERSDLNDEKE